MWLRLTSSRSLLLTGDVHSAVENQRGLMLYTPRIASGASFERSRLGQSHTLEVSHIAANLFLGVACQVTRPLKFLIEFSVAAGSRLRSGSYVQAFGLPAFLLKYTGAKLKARL